MNRAYICLALSFSLLLAACKKDEPTIPSKEEALAQLPPATQTGANMMGCLIDGKPMTAGTSILLSQVDCEYSIYDGQSYFLLYAKDRANKQMQKPYFGIRTVDKVYKEGIYPIWNSSAENFSMAFNDGKIYIPKDTCGILTITRLDTLARIISGTFSFQGQNDQNPADRINVTDGRFDFRYPYYQ